MQDIYLRAIEMEDIPFLHTLFNHPDIMAYWFSEPYHTKHELEEQFKKKNEHSRLFIITNNEKENIGLIGFYGINQRHRHAEFAIALDPDHQGKGYASKATKLVLDYAFYILNLRKIYLIVADTNARAHHIYEKVGFEIEGRLTEHYFINGTYEDAIMMGLFRKDYLENR
ncbi:MAG TPA: GNAT family N-acetyltransferase [Bacillota bacterium]|nr:GNAT family N-acetyltransferase [Bacillota bacterium]